MISILFKKKNHNQFKFFKICFLGTVFFSICYSKSNLFSDDMNLSETSKKLVSFWKKDSLCCLGFRNKNSTQEIINTINISILTQSEIITILGQPYTIYRDEPIATSKIDKAMISLDRLVYNAEIFCKNDTVIMNKNRAILRIDIDRSNDSVVKYEIIDLE